MGQAPSPRVFLCSGNQPCRRLPALGLALLLGLTSIGLTSVAATTTAAAASTGTATEASDPASRWLLLDAARNGSAVFAVGERGVILRSPDSGVTWRRCTAPAGETLTGLCFAPDGMHGWAVGHHARILATTDGGLSWKNNYTHSGAEASFLDVACVSATHVIAIGAFGFALESRDAGASWTPLSLPSSDRHLNRIHVTARGQIYIAGESGLLLRSTDGGDSWETLPCSYEGSFYGILPLSSGALLAHGLRGSLLLAPATPTGTGTRELPAWERLSVPQTGLLSTALQTSRGTVLVAGQARVYLISRDGGASFSAWNPGITSAVAELLEAPDGSILAFGENGVSHVPAP